MKPGRKLNDIIATEVMGWTKVKYGFGWQPPDRPGTECETPNYSGDIAAAWTIAEKLEKNFNFIGPGPDGWNAVFFIETDEFGRAIGSMGAIGETAAHAMCLAALRFIRERK